MRRLIALFCVVGFAAVVGCAARTPIVLRDPVGPLRAHVSADNQNGKLVVYSATRVTMSDQSEYPIHTSYTIYDQRDKVIKRVENTAGLFSQYPATVSLLPGEYRVKALAVGTGYVVVPIVVEPYRTTVVDLDGTALPQGAEIQSGPSGSEQWVRLPDGHVVGSQAACDATSCP